MRTKELLNRALERAPAERDAYLRQQCEGPEQLREARDLLAQSVSGFLLTPLPGTVVVLGGRYRLGEPIGMGAFGSVYRATDERTGGAVAVKTLHLLLVMSAGGGERVMRRFEREALTGRKLDHPRIVRVLDHGREPVPYLVMELIEGTTLERELERAGPLSVARAAPLLSDMLEALAHAHEAGVVHRDVKPANALIGADGRLRLADFGIARVAEAVSGAITATGELLGTPSYMSPEQALGQETDPRSDLFAVGLIAFELLGGKRAFRGAPAAVLHQIAHGPLPDMSSLPRPLQAWIFRACARRPRDRFASAHDMHAALTAAMSSPDDPRPSELSQAAGTRPMGPAVIARAARAAADLDDPRHVEVPSQRTLEELHSFATRPPRSRRARLLLALAAALAGLAWAAWLTGAGP